jgi:hypothetical protein
MPSAMSARITTTHIPTVTPVIAVKNRKPSHFILSPHSVLYYIMLYLLTLDLSISGPGFTDDLVDNIMKTKIIFMMSTSVAGSVFLYHRRFRGPPAAQPGADVPDSPALRS